MGVESQCCARVVGGGLENTASRCKGRETGKWCGATQRQKLPPASLLYSPRHKGPVQGFIVATVSCLVMTDDLQVSQESKVADAVTCPLQRDRLMVEVLTITHLLGIRQPALAAKHLRPPLNGKSAELRR